MLIVVALELIQRAQELKLSEPGWRHISLREYLYRSQNKYEPRTHKGQVTVTINRSNWLHSVVIGSSTKQFKKEGEENTGCASRQISVPKENTSSLAP